MSYGIMDDINKGTKLNTGFDNMTIGTVVDTNDPQQMGRVRVYCPAWDSDNVKVIDIPWAMYVAPFGGTISNISRGVDDNENISDGAVSYGAWHIPKFGANVIVMCIDKNPHFRVWLGCVFDQYSPHTLPHGRFINEDQNGPISSREGPIKPLSDNFNKAFNSDKKYEWRTRIADYSVASIDNNVVNEKRTGSKEVDDKEGYSLSRRDPKVTINNRKNYDSQVYCWVSPGFHSLSMDDRAENSRMRLRTSTGHQIIMDDTNERVYIMTAEGENWIEMDQKGNVDIYSSKRVSIRSKQDINLTSDETVRLHGKKGIHLSTEAGDIRMDAKKASMHINVDENYVINCANHYSAYIGSLDILSNTYITVGANEKLNLTGSTSLLTGTDSVFINGSSNVLISGSVIHLNGPATPMAEKPLIDILLPTYWTNRVPDHEPWARVIIKNPDININHIPEYESTNDSVNKIENGIELGRNSNWRR